MRSAGIALGALALASGFAAASVRAAEVDGAAAFKRCGVCHLANGEGVPSAFPPLAGRVSRIGRSDNGRAYLALAPSHGLTGTITVDGVRYQGFMPRQDGLAAADLAAALNYVAETLNHGRPATGFRPFTSAEIERILKARPTFEPTQVAALRAAIPAGDLSGR